MQSQQKRVKWSRGETAEALEERTDTGITSASVELMENCIPDIYGNVSRRPALKAIPLYQNYRDGDTAPYLGFEYDIGLQIIPFYITEDDIILVGIHTHSAPEFLRIQNGLVISKKIGASQCWNGVVLDGINWQPRPVSYAQQNNYLIVATALNTWKIQFEINAVTFTPLVEVFKYSAGWYAPQGTQTHEVNNSILSGLNISGNFYNYIYQNADNSTTVYSNTDTGIDGATNIPLLEEQMPLGSIIQLPKIGCYFRVEGYYAEDDDLYFSDTTFDGVLGRYDSVPATGNYCKYEVRGSGLNTRMWIVKYINGTNINEYQLTYGPLYVWVTVKNSASGTGYSKFYYSGANTPDNPWVEADQTDSSIRMFGSLLTPVADENAHDTMVSVETGYTSLQQPGVWSAESNFPHPTKLTFLDQRLWAGGWSYAVDQQYALVIGSQVARYTDFKNDYNQENEAITIDILTQFKEKIVHLINYNGLKIMTDSHEYTYQDGAVIKQSANGSLEQCEPVIFDSLCLYVDSTGCQVKAMQYEFQNNIFNSTTINQMAPHDLVWWPISMAAYEDKINSTGKYLFLVNEDSSSHPRLAVCNFVPSNQATIWNRWSFPEVLLNTSSGSGKVPLVFKIVNTKKEPLFMLTFFMNDPVYGQDLLPSIIYPAVLDFNGSTDITCTPTSNIAAVVKYTHGTGGTAITYHLIVPNEEVAVYADSEFKWMDTLTSTGALTKDISGLSNVTVGLPINATIRSHPIDVGGKTKAIKKRIGKARMSVRDTEPGAIVINDKTGYMNPAKDYISFYGVTGMKNEIRYTITNKNGAMFHLESLLMNIEYGTLDS